MKTKLAEPIFCFTSDQDWAPEWAVESLFDCFAKASIPITPFVTHNSPEINKRFASDYLSCRVGVHPNFLKNSDHGSTTEDVVNNSLALWPRAISYRSHGFADPDGSSELFAKKKIRYDSNVCFFLKNDIVPIKLGSGIYRFPVFWEDDVHYKVGLAYNFDAVIPRLHTSGLKIFNIHPLLYALNVPDKKFYQEKKIIARDLSSSEWKNHIHKEAGVKTFVDDLLRWLSGQSYRILFLYDLFHELYDPAQLANEQSVKSRSTTQSR